MQSDLVYFIIMLLHKEGKVRLPGVGNITLVRQSARFDEDSRNIYPPGSDALLSRSEGKGTRVLSGFISYKTGRSTDDVTSEIHAFVSTLKDRLQQEGTVNVEHLGTFSLENENIGFEASDLASGARSLGLKPVVASDFGAVIEVPETQPEEPAEVVQAAPVVPEDQQAEKTNVLVGLHSAPGTGSPMTSGDASSADERHDKSTPAPSAVKPEKVRRRRLAVPVILPIALLVFVGACIIAFIQYKTRASMVYPVEAYNRSPVTDSAGNQTDLSLGLSPGEETAPGNLSQGDSSTTTNQIEDSGDAASATSPATTATDEPQITDAPEVADEPEAATEEPVDEPLAAESSGVDPPAEEGPDSVEDTTAEPVESSGEVAAGQCIVVVGAFGVQANVDRMVQRITQMGFQPVTRSKGALTQVGISAQCRSAEITQLLQTMRSEVEAQAWILNPGN